MNRCEDYPCCGHEAGDCDGSLYGSDEDLKRRALIHFECSHEAGVCIVDDVIDEAFDEYTWEQEYLNHSSSITGLYEDY